MTRLRIVHNPLVDNERWYNWATCCGCLADRDMTLGFLAADNLTPAYLCFYCLAKGLRMINEEKRNVRF